MRMDPRPALLHTCFVARRSWEPTHGKELRGPRHADTERNDVAAPATGRRALSSSQRPCRRRALLSRARVDSPFKS